MRPRTAAEEHLARNCSESEYAAAYEVASRRVAMFDDVVRCLDARREELGMTKAELARRADMPPAGVRRLFSQQHKNPTLTSLVAIAEALDLHLGAAPAAGLLRRSGSANRDAGNPPEAIPAPSRVSGTRQRTA